jgi:hypothetical protein
MNPKEAVLLTRYVRALCPQQKFDEYTADAWFDVLKSYPLQDCQNAAAAVAGRQPFVSPAEIIAEIRKTRDDRADSFQGPGLPAEVPDADPDDVRAYLAALREQRTRAADGHELKPRKVAELLAGVGREVPPEIASVKRPGPLGVECPACGAAIGRPCRMGSGRERAPHSARLGRDEQAEVERRKAASARILASQPNSDIPDAEIVDEEAAS